MMKIAEAVGSGHDVLSSPIDATQYLIGFSPKSLGGLYLDICISVHMSWESTKDYEYSKIYYNVDPDHDFDESRVTCFRITEQGVEQKIRLVLPEEVKASDRVSFRIDPFPYCEPGRFSIPAVQILYEQDSDTEASHRADLMVLKQWTREQVVKCEQLGQREVEHFPESLCLEVTPRCNLTCSHCSTHGTPEAHERHNNQPEIPLNFLDHLGEVVFPSLTSITAIGRGEPLYLTDETWDRLIGHIRANHMLFSIVTNGVLLRKRLTPDLIPLIDTITVSIDGLEAETFSTNRGGASIDKVLSNVRYYHELRKKFNLPRRPKLCLSWTMKRNNIHEMPDFLEVVKEFEPDIMFTRHLMVFHEVDRHQSLVNDPDLCNFHLEKVYTRMKELRIRTECPPIAESDLFPTEYVTQAPGKSQANSALIAVESNGATVIYPDYHAAKTGRKIAPPAFEMPRVYPTIAPTPVTLNFVSPTAPVVPITARTERQLRLKIPLVVPLNTTKRPKVKPSKPGESPVVDPCMFVYRTANIHTDGKIHVCPRPAAPLVGDYHEKTFAQIWNGERYQRVRNTLDTENEFHECRYCWYRESKYHPQRFQRNEESQQDFSLFDPVRFMEKTWNFMHNQIEKLSAINRSTPNPHVERRLRTLRIENLEPMRPTIAIVPPDLLAKSNMHAIAVADISVKELHTDVLRGAMQSHRYLIVRNLFTSSQAGNLIQSMTKAHHHLVLKGHPVEQDLAWFSPANLSQYNRKDLTRRFKNHNGTLFAADSPHTLFELLELYDQLNFRYMLSRYFGEAPCITVRKNLLHHLNAPSAEQPWRHERSARDLPVNGIKLWVALDDCGADSGYPALELKTVAPHFNAGDAVFFDPLFAHRLSALTNPRGKTHAVETSFFAYSACPEKQIRMIF